MIRLAIRVRRADAEVVLAELLELAPSGVEEVALGEDAIEYAVYGAAGELPALPDLRAAAGGALVEISTTQVADDWSERWRAFHRPLVLGDRLTVRPPWAEPGTSSIDLVIDPGQAFGTGAHATTRLCLELLLELDPAGSFLDLELDPAGSFLDLGLDPAGSFLDLGCGSGVLAIAAARLGYDPVTALDYDPASVAATADNAAVNGVTLHVRRFDLRVEATPPAATVAANLLGPLLIEWAARLAGATELPRRVIASGLLATEADRVTAAFAPLGFDVAAVRRRGDWAALLLLR